MELTLELREESGLQWVLERLTPMSPFGRAAARALRWYAPGEEAALTTELDNVALALDLWNAAGPAPAEPEPCCCGAPRLDPASLKDIAALLRGVTRCLPLFHDIRGSLDRDPEKPFDLVELFEIKHFLVTLEQLTEAYAKLPPFQNLAFVPMSESLDLMDPDGRRLPAFSVSETYHPGLAPLRAEKAALERSIRAAAGERAGSASGLWRRRGGSGGKGCGLCCSQRHS